LLTEDDVHALLPELEAFHARFGRFFSRSESRAWSRKYLTGLLLPIERKNVENMAEQLGGHPRRLQEFVSESPWDDAGCIEEVQRMVGEQLGTGEGVLVLDDTGFPKKGKCSAGVGRQYSGTLGRTDNCQVGVFVSYASERGHTLVDRRLYLLRSWFEKEAVVSPKAGLPAGLEFQTKPELATGMLREITKAGHLPYRWVTADADYGDVHDLRQAVADLNAWYCFDVSSTAKVWTGDPGWKVPPRGRGRPPKWPQPTADSPEPLTVAELIASLPEAVWVRHRVTEGAHGPREYEFARLRVVEMRHQQPGPWAWLMARRRVGHPDEVIKYYLSNAPEDVGLERMAWAACLRWTIEENFKAAKGEVGLDHYEVTRYRGWYHHVTLAMMALAFLRLTQRSWAGKKRACQRAGDPGATGGRPAATRVDRQGRARLAPASAISEGRSSPGPRPALAA
jgi:SRSO17 transposase